MQKGEKVQIREGEKDVEWCLELAATASDIVVTKLVVSKVIDS